MTPLSHLNSRARSGTGVPPVCLLLLSAIFYLPSCTLAQVRSVSVGTNGVLVAPANFFDANAARIREAANAAGANTNNVQFADFSAKFGTNGPPGARIYPTNLTDAEISASAAIAQSKIAGLAAALTALTNYVDAGVATATGLANGAAGAAATAQSAANAAQNTANSALTAANNANNGLTLKLDLAGGTMTGDLLGDNVHSLGSAANSFSNLWLTGRGTMNGGISVNGTIYMGNLGPNNMVGTDGSDFLRPITLGSEFSYSALTFTLAAGGITDAKISTSAAIAKSKISTSGTWLAADIPSLDASKITTGTVDTARLGSGTANANTLLHGNQTYAAVAEGDLTLSDVTTANATTNRHGLLPKLPNDATKYLDGTGGFSTPAGGGGGGGSAGSTNYRSAVIELTVTGTNVNPNQIDWNLTNQCFRLTLTTNVFFGDTVCTNVPATNAHQYVQLELIQNATGGWSVTFTNSRWGAVNGVLPIISTNANAWDSLTLINSKQTNSDVVMLPAPWLHR